MPSHNVGIPNLDVLLLVGIDIDEILERVAVSLYKPLVVGGVWPDL